MQFFFPSPRPFDLFSLVQKDAEQEDSGDESQDSGDDSASPSTLDSDDEDEVSLEEAKQNYTLAAVCKVVQQNSCFLYMG